jgi:hypothetical protein
MLALAAVLHFVRKHYRGLGLGCSYIAAVGLGAYLHAWAISPPKGTVTVLPGNTTTITVPVDHLVTNTVTKYVKDTAGAAALMAENTALQARVALLTESLATYQSAPTSGPVTTVPTASVPVAEQPPHTTAPTVTRFSDWRLTFTSDGAQATYSLRQRFEILTTQSRLPSGVAMSLVRLYELGPGETRTPIPDITTMAVVADATRVHWSVHLAIQAGAAWAMPYTSPPLTVVAAAKTSAFAGIVGAQWLTRGRTHAPGDTWLAIATPVLYLTAGKREFGILPVSLNLGALKRQPFTNLWISPYVSRSRIGLGLTATF